MIVHIVELILQDGNKQIQRQSLLPQRKFINNHYMNTSIICFELDSLLYYFLFQNIVPGLLFDFLHLTPSFHIISQELVVITPNVLFGLTNSEIML